MKSLNGLLVFAMLTSCSTFSTGFSHAIKLEHAVEAATEAAQADYENYEAAKPVVPPAKARAPKEAPVQGPAPLKL